MKYSLKFLAKFKSTLTKYNYITYDYDVDEHVEELLALVQEEINDEFYLNRLMLTRDTETCLDCRKSLK
jgi:hypothetical protein